MLKLIKSIVDPQRNLIGFVIEGTEKEFGGMSKNKVQTPMTLQALIKRGFSNNQLAVVDNKFLEKNNFKINSLPMCVFTGTDYVDVDNTINLTKRFVQNNENIGFEVAFSDGSTLNFKYEQIIYLSNWFKPGNFVIRTSANGKNFISGKQGCIRLAELPETTLGEKSTAKRIKSTSKDKKETFDGALPNGFDILDVYGFIDSCGGCVINLPGEKYVGADTTTAELDAKAGFISLGIGEVASARPQYNATKLNVNANFKKVGVVHIPINGAMIPITTFTYRTKSIFMNGENNIKKFGITVPADKEAALVKALGGSLALSKITDEHITRPLGQVIDASSLVFYTVDTSQIDLISQKKQKNSILSSSEIAQLLKERFELNLLTKLCNPKTGMIKEIKSELGDTAIAEATGKKPFGIFATMNQDTLDTLTEAGIDIYTGAFNAVKAAGDSYKAPSKAASEDDDTVIIEYNLKGYDAGKISYKIIKDAAMNNDYTKVPKSVLLVAKELLSTHDLLQRMNKAQDVYNTAEKRFNEITKLLWMHNASMYLTGSKSKIHTHDSVKWSIDPSSRVKTATVYACAEVPGLTVKVSGVTI